MVETVTTGRAKRSTAGNRMRELLEKAHKESEEDALFAEDEDDGEFEAPQEQKDVFLDEFADTDEEVEDDEDEETTLRKEERRQAKSKAVFNPLVKAPRIADWSTLKPKESDLALLGPNVDISKMAPSTLILEIRKQRREQKRQQRSETRRSNLRASTLKTEQDLIEKEKAEKVALASSRKGRKAQHETGEVRGARPMTQDELIAAALEEEERNKEALTDWLKKEEERRELRRVGRKRVRGPRWTWISRTVGKLVEVVGEDGASQSKGVETWALETPAPESSKPPGEPAPGELTPAPDPAKEEEQRDEKEEAKAPGAADDAVDPKVAGGDSSKPEDPTVSSKAPEAVATGASLATGEPKRATTSTDAPAPSAGPGAAAGATDAQAATAESALTTAAATMDRVEDDKARPPSDTKDDAGTHEGAAVADAGGKSGSAAADVEMKDAPAPASATSPGAEDAAKDAATGTTGPPEGPPAASSDISKPAGAAAGAAPELPIAADGVAAGPATSTAPAPPGSGSGSAPGPGTTTGLASVPGSGTTPGAATAPGSAQASGAAPAAAADTPEAPTGPYTRNYLILSQIPGGLESELALILGNHVNWNDVKVIPARNRPINRKPPMDPMCGQPAKYRHPASMVPYASVEGYKTIEAVLGGRYVWSEAGWWAGGEADEAAEGIGEVEGWKEAVCRGWLGGKELKEPEPEPEVVEDVVEPQEEAEEVKFEEKRKSSRSKKGGSKRKASVAGTEDEDATPRPKKKAKSSRSKSKRRR